MSYLRPLSLNPGSLKEIALDSWLTHLLGLIRDDHIISRGKKEVAARAVATRSTSSNHASIISSVSVQSFSESLKVLHDFSEDFEDAIQEMTTHSHNNKVRRLDNCQQVFHYYHHYLHQGRPHGGNLLLNPNSLSRHLDALLPLSVQEEAFHKGAHLLKKELYFDMFPLYFCLLWKPEFRHLDLPPLGDPQDRIAALEFLTSGNDVVGECHSECYPRVESAKFRLFETSEISIEESYLMNRILRRLNHLRVLVLWWGCDDAMLNIVGSTCEQLESLDVWRSSAVTDLGLKMLLTSDDNLGGYSSLCSTLKRLGIKETSVSHLGCVIALIRCINLEVLNFSHTSVVKEFFQEIRLLDQQVQAVRQQVQGHRVDDDDDVPSNRTYALKSLFMPITNGNLFKDAIRSFPNLEDLRLWTAVTQLR